ncbi:hypothetical protein BCD67_22630 [Oscillatoriales cyanobacterium USR001]|nr:hypothetical protein BCD67_22630 [Oscillatoriales cyanobacterium USR001]
MTESILRLPVKTISKLISELSALQDRLRSGELLEIPSVTLLLKSGQSLSGVVVRALQPGLPENEATLLLQSRDNSMDMTYVPIAAIGGVTVHYTAQSMLLLSDGKIRASYGRVPSRLELERQARAISAQFAGIDLVILWDELPRFDAAFQSIELLLNDFQAILLTICGDDIGMRALREKVTGVSIGVDTTANVCLKENILEIRLRVEEQDLIYQPKGKLQEAIEKLL